MCNANCIVFAFMGLKENDVKNKRVLEVGSANVNGSVRNIIKNWNPISYVGIDIASGPGVDVVCDASKLVEVFGEGAFDIVLSFEVLEHVLDWKSTITNLKRVLSPKGHLILTTRSMGFPYHAYPHDYWRFEKEDMERIFSDLEIQSIEEDQSEPGVFFRGKKSINFVEVDLHHLKIYSVITNKRMENLSKDDINEFIKIQKRIGKIKTIMRYSSLLVRQLLKGSVPQKYRNNRALWS